MSTTSTVPTAPNPDELLTITVGDMNICQTRRKWFETQARIRELEDRLKETETRLNQSEPSRWLAECRDKLEKRRKLQEQAAEVSPGTAGMIFLASSQAYADALAIIKSFTGDE